MGFGFKIPDIDNFIIFYRGDTILIGFAEIDDFMSKNSFGHVGYNGDMRC